jgi:hypothetical protein
MIGTSEFTDRVEPFTNKAEIKRIIIHDDWSPSAGTPFDADIALIELKEEIIFTNLIIPICLPNADTNVYEVKGTVVGHGITNTTVSEPSRKLRHVEIKSVKDSRCLYMIPSFANIGSERMFCAGQKGKNPCKGKALKLIFVCKNS